MGQTLARLLLTAGHKLVLAGRHEPAEMAALTNELGPQASAVRAADLAAVSEVLVLAVRWPQVPAAIGALGPIAGKVLLDTTNNRIGPRPEDIVRIENGLGSSEIVARMLPGARVVKIFNNQPITALASLDPESGSEPKAIFLAGDDPQAKATASAIVRSLGAIPIDTGSLALGGRLQNTGAPLAGLGRLLEVAEAHEVMRHALAARRSIETDWT